MIALPLLAATISLIFTIAILRDARRAPRPDKVSWAIAFAIFTVAAGAEALGDLVGWTAPLARVYYLTGAVLVTLFLGLGQLYLLAGRRIARFAPGVTLGIVAVAGSLVLNAPIDESRLATEHWRAIDRGGALIALVAFSNAFGVVALLGGSLWSAWQFARTRTHRHRMIGCLLIAAGTLVIAAKGYLARLGIPVDDFGFYLLLTIGASVIFAGYLQTKRPDSSAGVTAGEPVVATHPDAAGDPDASVPVPQAAAVVAPTPSEPIAAAPAGITVEVNADPGVGFIESRFLPLDDGALTELAAAWSAPRIATTTLTPQQARRVWALRCRLSPAGQEAFDRHSLPAVLQLAELYDGVFSSSDPIPAPTPPPSRPEPLSLVGAPR
ncbi:MAG TPA: hypothetical protein VGT61_11005 [Thermomicrobiales bacterium]|nr:hypothetical protein [Thermomicrobiales bacterium]